MAQEKTTHYIKHTL